MMIKLLIFSLLSSMLGASVAMYLELGTVLVIAGYVAGGMAATFASVLIAITRQDTSGVTALQPSA